MDTQQFDALIIGFGKAGKTLAVALANAKKVALVERSPRCMAAPVLILLYSTRC